MSNSGALATFVGRWWAVLLAGAVIAAGGGYAAGTQITKTYEAETQLLVGPLNTTSDLEASGTLARTYAQLGETRPLLARAIAAAGDRMTSKDLADATTIEANDITRIVSIRVQDSDRARAARLANSIADRLVELSNKRAGAATSGVARFQNDADIAALPANIRAIVIGAASRVFDPIAGRLSIAETAAPPLDPVKPSMPLVVLLAALAGLMLAGAVAMAWESRGDRRRSIGSDGADSRDDQEPVAEAPAPADPAAPEPAAPAPEPAAAGPKVAAAWGRPRIRRAGWKPSGEHPDDRAEDGEIVVTPDVERAAQQ